MNVKKYYKYLIVLIGILSVLFTFIFFYVLYPLKYKQNILSSANKYNLQPELIAGIILAESSFNKNAKSDKGAIGLMQVLPSTAKWVCEIKNIEFNEQKLYTVEYNIDIGCCYFEYLLNKFGSVDLAIISYNAGEGNLTDWLKNKEYSKDGKTLYNIPFKETKNYLQKVKRFINIYRLRF